MIRYLTFRKIVKVGVKLRKLKEATILGKRECLTCLLINYREVQRDSTPEIEVFHMPFERSYTINRMMKSIKQHIKYFNFRSKVQLDHPVHLPAQSIRLRAGPGGGCSCLRAERGGARRRRSRWGSAGRSAVRDPGSIEERSGQANLVKFEFFTNLSTFI